MGERKRKEGRKERRGGTENEMTSRVLHAQGRNKVEKLRMIKTKNPSTSDKEGKGKLEKIGGKWMEGKKENKGRSIIKEGNGIEKC